MLAAHACRGLMRDEKEGTCTCIYVLTTAASQSNSSCSIVVGSSHSMNYHTIENGLNPLSPCKYFFCYKLPT